MSHRLIAEGTHYSYEELTGTGMIRDGERVVATWLRGRIARTPCLRVINNNEHDLAPIYERVHRGDYLELQFFATDTRPTPLEYSDYH